MELEGTLRQFPLSELLSLMVSSAVTGAPGLLARPRVSAPLEPVKPEYDDFAI